MTTTERKPLYFVIWYKPAGGRWQKAGRATTHAEAVSLIDSRGDWWIAPVHDPGLADAPGGAPASGASPSDTPPLSPE